MQKTLSSIRNLKRRHARGLHHKGMFNFCGLPATLVIYCFLIIYRQSDSKKTGQSLSNTSDIRPQCLNAAWKVFTKNLVN